jgi:ribose transport system substrate-binding protein
MIRRFAAARPCFVSMALVAVVIAIGACGSDSSDSSSTATTGTTGSGKPLSYFQDHVSALYKGTYESPPSTSPKPQPGKLVYAIPYGLGASAGETAARGAELAGKSMGWRVKVIDGKFDPSAQLSGIREAIAAHADGIFLYVIDCPPIQAGLQEAKKAGVMVTQAEGLDCSDLKSGAPSLFTTDAGPYTAQPFSGVGSFKDWVRAYAAAQADAIIDHTKGKAKILDMVETDANATLEEDVGFLKEVALCGTCKVEATVKFTGAEFGPKLQEKVSQALLQHPDINAVFGIYDAPVTGGIAAAVRSSGRVNDIYVTGGEGDPPNADLVRNNQGQNMGVGIPVEWEAFAAMDALNRAFHGGKTVPNGIGLAIWDKTHSLPAHGESWQPSTDFKSAYYKTWGVEAP